MNSIFSGIVSTLLPSIGFIFVISICRIFFGFDPQTKADKLMKVIEKKLPELSITFIFISLIIYLLFPVYNQEARKKGSIDRKSPPTETWVNPDIDMNSPLMRVLVNSKSE